MIKWQHIVCFRPAMSELLNAGSGNPLEQFVLLAKNAKGAAAVELIKQALEVLYLIVSYS